jgi:hypothetical protein
MIVQRDQYLWPGCCLKQAYGILYVSVGEQIMSCGSRRGHRTFRSILPAFQLQIVVSGFLHYCMSNTAQSGLICKGFIEHLSIVRPIAPPFYSMEMPSSPYRSHKLTISHHVKQVKLFLQLIDFFFTETTTHLYK